MTRQDIVHGLTNRLGLSHEQATAAVSAIFEAMVQALRRGEEIELRGFGSFRFRQRRARTGRNPRTGAKVNVPAKKLVFFKPGKELRELLR
ncbi:MAG: HU family DNA-binding protein [Thermoanaerobaculaceae bacterium]